MRTFKEQVQNNSVALISLVVAVTSLGYNTWRNETTEEHRNIRMAAFEVLGELGDLQEVISYFTYYLPDAGDALQRGRTRVEGYGDVLRIRDLMNLMPEPGPGAGETLFQLWNERVNELGSGPQNATARAAEMALSKAVDDTRAAVVEVLTNLE